MVRRDDQLYLCGQIQLLGRDVFGASVPLSTYDSCDVLVRLGAASPGAASNVVKVSVRAEGWRAPGTHVALLLVWP